MWEKVWLHLLSFSSHYQKDEEFPFFNIVVQLQTAEMCSIAFYPYQAPLLTEDVVAKNGFQFQEMCLVRSIINLGQDMEKFVPADFECLGFHIPMSWVVCSTCIVQKNLWIFDRKLVLL